MNVISIELRGGWPTLKLDTAVRIIKHGVHSLYPYKFVAGAGGIYAIDAIMFVGSSVL